MDALTRGWIGTVREISAAKAVGAFT